MVTRNAAPAGAPCWADLWTSDVDAARHFYGELFGWEAGDPDPQYGGYFLFSANGAPVAGCMGEVPGISADNTWKPYLSTDDIAATMAAATANGATVRAPSMPVGDLGVQGILVDPGGATIGLWQPGVFAGFTTIEEPGTPSWFELHTRTHFDSVTFYRTVFGWQTEAVSDTDDFRYFTFKPAGGGPDAGGIMDATAFRPEGTPDVWDIYWEVADCRASVHQAKSLGATVMHQAEDTPYGVLAQLADPSGALLKLRTAPKG